MGTGPLGLGILPDLAPKKSRRLMSRKRVAQIRRRGNTYYRSLPTSSRMAYERAVHARRAKKSPKRHTLPSEGFFGFG